MDPQLDKKYPDKFTEDDDTNHQQTGCACGCGCDCTTANSCCGGYPNYDYTGDDPDEEDALRQSQAHNWTKITPSPGVVVAGKNETVSGTFKVEGGEGRANVLILHYERAIPPPTKRYPASAYPPTTNSCECACRPGPPTGPDPNVVPAPDWVLTQTETQHPNYGASFTEAVSGSETVEKRSVLRPVEFKTETVADQPANRARKKIGIGEEVRIDLISPSDAQVTWALKSGSHGQLISPLGYPSGAVMFVASEQEKKAEVEATLTNYQNAKAVVTFDVIAPKNITFEKTEGPGIAIDNNPAGIRMEFKADWYYGPDDVCFYNVVGGETAAPAVRTGCFLNDPDTNQPHTAWIGGPGGNLTKTVTQGKGTKCQISDGIRLGRWQPPAIDKTGRCEWNLQWKYRLKWGSGDGTPFAPVTQWMEVISGQGFNGFNGKGGKGDVNVP